MTASPPAAPGMPSEEDIARAMRPAVWARCDAAGVTSESTGSGITLGDLTARATSLLDANTILSLIRPAFEAKDAEIRKLVMLLDKQMGTPCEQIRHQQEIEALQAKLAQAVEALKAKERQIAEWDRQEDASADEDIKALVAALQGRMSNEEIEGVFAEMKAIRVRSASAAARGET